MEAASAMDCIMIHVTQGDEIVDRVFTAVLVVLSLVQFQHFCADLHGTASIGSSRTQRT
jgi:hypothetical protein